MSDYPKNPEEIANLLNEESTPDPSTMDLGHIYNYAIVNGRWPEGEPYIMKDPYGALQYARFVIKDRWPEAEPYIMEDPYDAYEYAQFVIRGRWREAEPIIMTDPQAAYLYARHVIKGRWPEYEEYMIRQHPVSDNINPMDDYQDSLDDDWWEFYQQDYMNV